MGRDSNKTLPISFCDNMTEEGEDNGSCLHSGKHLISFLSTKPITVCKDNHMRQYVAEKGCFVHEECDPLCERRKKKVKGLIVNDSAPFYLH